MRSFSIFRRISVAMIFVAAALSLALAIYAYVTPLTGVNGSLGALVVVFASLVLAIGAVLLLFVGRGGWHVLLWILLLLGLIGTGFAALLLHRWWIAIALAVALVGLLVDVIGPRSRRGPARSEGRTS